MFEYLLWVTLGSMYGMLVGVIPIAGVTTALITVFGFADYFMAMPFVGLAFVMSIIAACAAADSYTSILTGIPGASTTAACVIDGYPMSQQGQAGRAMGITIADSLFNGLLYGILAFSLLPLYSKIILWFGIPEMAAFMLTAVACVGFVVSKSLWKSLFAIAVGIFLGLIGQEPSTGVARFTGGWDYIEAGIQFIPLISGLFGIPELVWGWNTRNDRQIKLDNYWSQFRQGVVDCIINWRDTCRGGFIGFITGLIPGVGGAVGDFLAYGATVNAHPKEQFGNGNPKGLLGCEGANSAQKVSSLIPAVLFGIPAAPFAAIAMALCMYFGMELGTPQLLKQPEFVWSLMAGFIGGTIVVAIASMLLMKYIIKILEVPFWIYATAIVAVIIYANIQYTGTYNDIVMLAACSLLGIACKYFDISRPAILVTFVIAERLEKYLKQTAQLYDVSDLLTRPLFVIIMMIAFGILVAWFVRGKKGIVYV
jgi:putative tricarboxylic transport membrane protein